MSPYLDPTHPAHQLVLSETHTLSSRDGGALPTPPFTSPDTIADPFLPTRSLLDSLVAFYHQERMWVYRTRASLELAFDEPFSMHSTDAAADNNPMNAGGNTQGCTHASMRTHTASGSGGQDAPHTSDYSSGHVTGPTLLARRKKPNFKLKLEGISTRGRGKPGPGRARAPPIHGQGPQEEPGVRILELFESMMEARMESCQRVNKLVRQANRADLYVR